MFTIRVDATWTWWWEDHTNIRWNLEKYLFQAAVILITNSCWHEHLHCHFMKESWWVSKCRDLGKHKFFHWYEVPKPLTDRKHEHHIELSIRCYCIQSYDDKTTQQNPSRCSTWRGCLPYRVQYINHSQHTFYWKEILVKVDSWVKTWTYWKGRNQYIILWSHQLPYRQYHPLRTGPCW